MNLEQTERKQERTGCTRGDPSDRCLPHAGDCKRIPFQRSVPSLSADLETLCGKPDLSGGVNDTWALSAKL